MDACLHTGLTLSQGVNVAMRGGRWTGPPPHPYLRSPAPRLLRKQGKVAER
jgi:hypothetical protein